MYIYVYIYVYTYFVSLIHIRALIWPLTKEKIRLTLKTLLLLILVEV